jgi:hypothetical protein
MEFATEMVANAACQGLRIAEIPTILYPDKRGRPPHLRSFRDGWRHLRFILTYAPDYLYLAPGCALLAIGLALQAALVAGPLNLGGYYFGIHFLSLGSMLSLVGFNAISLGVVAKSYMSRRYEFMRSRVTNWVRHGFRLEHWLLIGGGLVAAGLATDATIFARWLAHGRGPMDETVHLAFVAATAVVLGVNIVFSAFLVGMLAGAEDY